MNAESAGAVPPHDAERWGPLSAQEEGTAVPLVRLADVVRHVLDSEELPLRPAAIKVFEKLKAVGPLKLYGLRPGNWAEPDPENSPWARFADGPGWDGFLISFNKYWVCSAERKSDLDKGGISHYAITAEAAAHLFGYGAKEPKPATVLQLASAEKAPAPLPELVPTKEPGADWTGDDLAELLRQFEQLKGEPHKLKVAAVHGMLSEAWGIAPNSVKTYLTKARKRRKGPMRQQRRA